MTPPTTEDGLVLGPLLRHVDETSASVWVETADAGTRAGDRRRPRAGRDA